MCPAAPTTTDFIASGPSPATSFAHRALATAGPLTAPPFALRLRRTAARTPLPLPNPIEDLDEAEIDLPHFHVDANDLHLHFVAEPIDLLRVLTAQQVRCFHEPV